MDAGHLRRVGALAAVTALGATGLASSRRLGRQLERADDEATITMEQQGRQLFFDGPNTVRRGAELEIVNNTDPQNDRAAHVLARQEGRAADDGAAAADVLHEATTGL